MRAGIDFTEEGGEGHQSERIYDNEDKANSQHLQQQQRSSG